MIGRPTDHPSRLAAGEYADGEVLERELVLDPDGTMRRREFLARTAALAGSA